MLIPNRRLHEFGHLARTRARRGFQRGLHVRVRGDRLNARIYEASRNSTAPMLKTRLREEPDGTRLVGHVDWAYVELQPFIMATIALMGVAGVTVGRVSRQWVIIVVGLLFALGFSCLAVTTFRGKSATKAFEERRLRQELVEMFQGRRPHRRR